MASLPVSSQCKVTAENKMLYFLVCKQINWKNWRFCEETFQRKTKYGKNSYLF